MFVYTYDTVYIPSMEKNVLFLSKKININFLDIKTKIVAYKCYYQ